MATKTTNKPDYKINCQAIHLALEDFETQKDQEASEIFFECMHTMNNGVVITPIYSERGELMSFVVDSKKAHEIVENKLNSRELSDWANYLKDLK